MTSEIKNKTYSSVQDEIEELNLSKKERLISLGIALGTSLILFAGPIALFANLLMFTNYQIAFSLIIAVMVIGFIFLSDYLYLHLICKKRVEGLYHIWAVDILFVSLVVLIVYFGLIKFVFKLV